MYLDENVSGRFAGELRTFGHDVVTTPELGRKGATDVSQLTFAAREGRIFITYDTDHFEMLHEAWQTWPWNWSVSDVHRHAGILLLPDPGILPVADAARAVTQLLARNDPAANRFLFWAESSGWQEIVVDL